MSRIAFILLFFALLLPGMVFAQVALGNLPPPVLYTDAGGTYQQAAPDLNTRTFNYTMPADQPVPPGDSFNPTLSGAASPQAPVLATSTVQASPDHAVVLGGANFTALSNGTLNDTTVWIYSQTTPTNGALAQAYKLNESPVSATALVGASTPYGMYLLWVQNANGISQPVRVNAPEAWWLGPNHGASGGLLSVYGVNLSYENGTATSYVYVRPWGAGSSVPSIPATVTQVNPYKVTFQAPSGLAGNADYEVWVHNGHGGQYGWAGPLRLHVDASNVYTWRGTVRNVTSYGATPNDQTDDTAAIQAAINAAQPGDVIYFPAGQFIVSSKLTIYQPISVQGDGRTLTTIYTPASTPYQDAIFEFLAFPSSVSNINFVCDAPSLYTFGGVVFFDGNNQTPVPSGGFVDSASFTLAAGTSYTTIGARWVNDIHVTNSTFVGPQALQANNSFEVFFQGNTIAGNWPDTAYSSQAAVAVQSSYQLDMSGNSASSLSTTGNNRSMLTRLLVAQGQGFGATAMHYVSGNTTQGLGCATLTCGEQILFEAPGAFYSGASAGINGRTLTFSGVDWAPNLFATENPSVYEPYGTNSPALAVIQNGTGTGQYRRISSNTSNSITVDRGWDVPPDSTSVIAIVTGSYKSAVYANNLAGFLPSNPSTNNGVVAYGATFGLVVAGNTISNIPRGIQLSALNDASCVAPGTPSIAVNCPIWGALVVGNTISNVGAGIVSWTQLQPGTPQYLGPMVLNNAIRDNVITNVIPGDGQTLSLESGIMIGDPDSTLTLWPLQQNALVEHNQISSSPTFITLLGAQTQTALRSNTMYDPGLIGSTVALQFYGTDAATALYNDTYSSSAGQRYAGSTPGPQQRISSRSLQFTTTAAESATVPLRNTGTAPLAVAVQSSSTWLGASLDTSTIPDETGVANLTVTVTPSGLPAGAYSGTVTVTGGNGINPETINVALTVPSAVPDTVPPVVNLTAPAAGSTVSGVTVITATASDNVGVVSVQFWINGVLASTSSTAPYSYTWNTAQATNGVYTITAAAFDAAGNSGSAQYQVTVYNSTNAPIISTPFVIGTVLGAERNNYAGWVGAQIQVGSSPVTVTALGRIALAGNSGTHTVKIVTASTGADVPGASATVAMAGSTPGQFQYAQLAAAVVLQANTLYFVVAQEALNGDLWCDFNTTLTTTAVAQVTNAIYSSGATWGLAGTTNHSYGPVSFQYQTAAPLGTTPSIPTPTPTPTVSLTSPAPGSTVFGQVTIAASASDPTGIASVQFWINGALAGTSTSAPYTLAWNTTAVANGSYTLMVEAYDPGGYTNSATLAVTVNNPVVQPSTALITGMTLGTFRNDYTGWVGMQIVVQSSPITVSSLGRIAIAGNSGQHSVKIVNALTGADVPGATVQVNMAGSIPGQVQYAVLAAPVTLQANTAYFIVTQEVSGGDQWCDFNTVVTTTNAATEIGAVYSSGSDWALAGTVDRTYGPVSLQYQQ